MKNDSSNLRTLGLFAVIVADLVVYTAAGLGGAYALWKYQGAPQWVFVPGGLGGLALAFFQIYRTTRGTIEKEEKESKQ